VGGGEVKEEGEAEDEGLEGVETHVVVRDK
jgi:hypothetical protein